ncbi:MAG: sulfurtransferase, partial [Acidimicrobiia bacterium]
MDGHLVSTDWLASQLDDPDLVVLDCTVWLESGPEGYTSVSGRDNWLDGHIPGAGFADLTTELCDRSSALRFALPSPQGFCTAMEQLGVSDSSRVVLYDCNRAMWA